MGRVTPAEQARRRAERRRLAFGTGETNKAKDKHEGLVDDRGRKIGTGVWRDGALYTEITPTSRATGRSRRSGVSMPTAAISLRGTKLFPVKEDGKLKYVERGALTETKKPEETSDPDPDTDLTPDPPSEEDLTPENVTETSPNKGNMPMSWAEYESWLGNKGVQMRGGYQSNALPGLATSEFDGENVDFESQTWRQASDEAKGGFKKGAEELGLETMSVPAGAQYGNTAMSQTDYFNTGEEQAGGAQEGMSSAADVGDQSRALRIPKGARQREMFFRDNPNYGQEDNTPEPMTSGLSARSRAFLDAEPGQGVMGVMRETNAANNILRQGDKIAIKTGDNQYQDITQEGYEDIIQNQRDAQTYKEDFLRQYVPATSTEAQSPDAVSPVPASFPLNAEKIVDTDLTTTPVSTQEFGQIMDSKQGMFLDADNLTNQVLGNDREPLMREDLLSKISF